MMIDNDMTNILTNFASASTGKIVDAKTGNTKVNDATIEKNQMQSLLEGLDAAQKSVNQMPATHKMAKNTDTRHPASKYLVGGEFDDEVELDEATPTADRKREDNYSSQRRGKIQPGASVHIGHHTAGGSGIDGEVTKIEDGFVFIKNADGQTYKGRLKNTTVNEAAVDEDTIAKHTPPRTQMNKKQSFADIFRSMDETEDDLTARFKKELHDEKTSRALAKGTNGKFDLAEEDSGWGDELIEALRLLIDEFRNQPDEVVAGVEDLIQQYEMPMNEHTVTEGSNHSSRYQKFVKDFSGDVQEFGIPPDELVDDLFADSKFNWVLKYYRTLPGFKNASKRKIKHNIAIDIS